MSTFKFSDYPGAGQVQMDKGFHQAVEVNGIIYISGQGGWDETVTTPRDTTEQVRLAFDNTEAAVKAAGAVNGLKDVFKYTIYLTTMDILWQEVVEENMQRIYGSDCPPVTVVQVAKLAFERMAIEIDAMAKVTSGTGGH